MKKFQILLSHCKQVFFRVVSGVMVGLMYASSVYSSVVYDYPDAKVNVKTTGYRYIVDVERIAIQSPVGTVPRLPDQIWAISSNRQSEYRLVKWSN